MLSYLMKLQVPVEPRTIDCAARLSQCVHVWVGANFQLSVTPFLQLTRWLCVYVFSSHALQHHDHHLDLHGPGVRPGHLSGHHHLQETARLHFTTLPIAAVCGTLSYTTLRASLCVLLIVIKVLCTAYATYIHL